MIYSAQFYFFFAVSGSIFYWALPRRFYQARYALIILCSFSLVFSAYPYAAVLACVVTLFAWFLCRLGEAVSNERLRGVLPFLIFLPLLTLDLVEAGQAISSTQKVVFSFGLSYYTLKLFGSIQLAWKTSKRSFVSFLSTALFFPAFPAGPIDFHETFSRDAVSVPFDLKLYLSGLLRFGSGILKLYVISELCNDLLASLAGQSDLSQVSWGTLNMGTVYLFCIVKFLSLYFNFSGYTDIAIAIGRMFGLRLSENFRYPLFAYNIQNFWQRWHLSLSNFVSRFIFLPLIRRTGRPVFSIFFAFVLVGLWHKLSLLYLLWGIGHGAALALLMARSGRKKIAPPLETLQDYGLRGLSIVVTISYVSILSTFANQPDLATGGRLLMSLVGL